MAGEKRRYWDLEHCAWVPSPAPVEAVPEQSAAPDEERVAVPVEADVRSR